MPQQYNIEIVMVSAEDIELETRVAGPEDGTPIVLLHGFPECWATWKHQIPALASAGFRVYAPNMRGYGHSSKPSRVDQYHIDRLASDIDAIRRHAGVSECHVVGHDWGAIVAWWYAIHYPDNTKSLSILNVPHPEVFLATLFKNPIQFLKSWYVFFFQIPWIPEAIVTLNRGWIFKKVLQLSSNKDSYTQDDIEELEQHWLIPGAMTAMINYYRSVIRSIPRAQNEGKVHCPVQILWGEKDLALTLKMARQSLDYAPNSVLTTYPDATHWLAHDKPDDIVNKLTCFCNHAEQLTPQRNIEAEPAATMA